MPSCSKCSSTHVALLSFKGLLSPRRLKSCKAQRKTGYIEVSCQHFVSQFLSIYEFSQFCFCSLLISNLSYNGAIKILQLIHQFLNESYMERFGSEPEAWKLDLLWATSVSVYLIGGCGGAFSVGWFANTFGR